MLRLCSNCGAGRATTTGATDPRFRCLLTADCKHFYLSLTYPGGGQPNVAYVPGQPYGQWEERPSIGVGFRSVLDWFPLEDRSQTRRMYFDWQRPYYPGSELYAKLWFVNQATGQEIARWEYHRMCTPENHPWQEPWFALTPMTTGYPPVFLYPW